MTTQRHHAYRTSRPSKPRAFRPTRLLLPLAIVLVFFLLLSRTNNLQTSPPPDQCFIVGHNPHARTLWQFNSRSLCLSSSVCLSTENPDAVYYQAANPYSTKCTVVNPAFIPDQSANHLIKRDFSTCSVFQRRKVICTHGKGLIVNSPQCPDLVRQLDPGSLPNKHWLDDFTLLIPSYPFPENIFHFAGFAATIPYFIDHLPQMIETWGISNARDANNNPYFNNSTVQIRKLNIIMRTPKQLLDRDAWQKDLLNILLDHRLRAKGMNVTIQHLAQDLSAKHDHVCLRNALVLGRRGHINAWGFTNGTAVPLHGRSVPRDAVYFKRAVYDAMDIPARLPRGNTSISELPPLVLGYAKRLGSVTTEKWNIVMSGTVRQLSAEDERWLGDMLKDETDKAGVRLHVFTTTGEEPLKEQVKNIVNVGFAVGLHGANLVNTIFMHPFGALLEILPGNVTARCYKGGMNSGLAYYRHDSGEVATPEESGCGPEHELCQSETRYRRVKLGSTEDRNAVRGYVQRGLEHLLNLHKKYPKGIPVTYNEKTAYYDIDQKL